jgi:hypothetical protein
MPVGGSYLVISLLFWASVAPKEHIFVFGVAGSIGDIQHIALGYIDDPGVAIPVLPVSLAVTHVDMAMQ